MSNLTVSIKFTKSGALGPGQPATGLTLSDIDLYLTAQHKDTGAETVIWDGTQNPTSEISNVGTYIRIYSSADLETYNYHAAAVYNGVQVLDQDWIGGSVGTDNMWDYSERTLTAFGEAAVTERDYIVYQNDGVTPLEGASVWISTDLAGSNIKWRGTSDEFGYARDSLNGKPRLSAGAWYFWVDHPVHPTPSFPDLEIFV